MKVDIKNRHERTGMLRKTDHYFVDVTVHFTEEEKQLIKQHNYGNQLLVQRINKQTEKEGPSGLMGSVALMAKTAAFGLNDGHLRVHLLLKGTDSHSLPDPLSAREYQAEVMESLRNLKAHLEGQSAGTEDSSVEL